MYNHRYIYIYVQYKYIIMYVYIYIYSYMFIYDYIICSFSSMIMYDFLCSCVCGSIYVSWLSSLKYGETIFPVVFSEIAQATARLLHCTIKATEPGRAKPRGPRVSGVFGGGAVIHQNQKNLKIGLKGGSQ